MASAVASTSAARTATSATPRRVNRRTLRASRAHTVAALAELYHLAPTFVPAHHAPALQQHVTETLTPIAAETARPRPINFRDLVQLNRHLDLERVRLTAHRNATASLQQVDIAVPANYNDDNSFSSFSASFQPLGPDGSAPDRFDYRGSFYHAYRRGGEPPLAQRLRQVVDALHGTSAGGRAGPETLQEHGDRAVRWNRELEQAQQAAREQRTRDEEESRAFQDAFDDEARP